MPLDALDQETVNKLPRLSELHAAYGVQVNKIDVDELFALYERTGFLYPEKAARLLPHMDKVKENWRSMLRAEESLLYILTAGDTQRGRAALAVWRSARHGWTYQHLVSENNPYASRAVMLAMGAESLLKGSDESSQDWFRPENRFPARVFGSMVNTIGGSLSSSQQHAYFALPRRASLREDPEFRVVPYEPSRNKDLCAMALLSRGHVYVVAEELAGDVPFKNFGRTLQAGRPAQDTARLPGVPEGKGTAGGRRGRVSGAAGPEFQLSGESLRPAAAFASFGKRDRAGHNIFAARGDQCLRGFRVR
jgi:hypothetical protein